MRVTFQHHEKKKQFISITKKYKDVVRDCGLKL